MGAWMLVVVVGVEFGETLTRDVLSEASVRIETDGVCGIAWGRIPGEAWVTELENGKVVIVALASTVPIVQDSINWFAPSLKYCIECPQLDPFQVEVLV